jgi:DNA modification methylase
MSNDNRTQNIITGNSMEVLRTLEDGSVDQVITSPPYYSLRNYNGPSSVWGGSQDCNHEWSNLGEKTIQPIGMHKDRKNQNYSDGSTSDLDLGTQCKKCGAWIGQLGLEPTPEQFVDNLCSIFDEVRRVLKPTGTCWIVIGDTYGGTQTKKSIEHGDRKNPKGRNLMEGNPNKHLKKKCLVQIPSRLSIEMCNRGWILRNKIIWHKPNAMPEPVKDRFTVDYEEILFFSKSEKYYFKRQLEPLADSTIRVAKCSFKTDRSNVILDQNVPVDIEKREGRFIHMDGRNMRSVWDISTTRYEGDHFAVFPEQLVERIVSAGCPGGGTVLDPFCGSGTTLEVCRKMNCNAIGIEINPEYKKQIVKRAMLDIPHITSYAEVVTNGR